MKKRKINKRSTKIRKISLTQEQAELSYSETHLVEELKRRRNDNTPDYLDLNLKQNHFVFVYGTLKTGERNTHFLDNCPFLGEGYVAVKGFNMKVSPLGGFPIIFETKDKTAEHIWGEIYVVSPRKIAELDKLESNGVMYQRKPFWVWMEDQRVVAGGKNNLKPAERCWMYVGNPIWWQGRDMVDYPLMTVANRKVYNYNSISADRIVKEAEKKTSSLFDSWAHEGVDYVVHDDDWKEELDKRLDDKIPF